MLTEAEEKENHLPVSSWQAVPVNAVAEQAYVCEKISQLRNQATLALMWLYDRERYYAASMIAQINQSDGQKHTPQKAFFSNCGRGVKWRTKVFLYLLQIKRIFNEALSKKTKVRDVG